MNQCTYVTSGSPCAAALSLQNPPPTPVLLLSHRDADVLRGGLSHAAPPRTPGPDASRCLTAPIAAPSVGGKTHGRTMD